MEFSFPSYFTDKTCYFAAANGYSGFRSYFSEVFAPEDFHRIYILKGGPGTGKSRLLKNVGRVFESRGCRTEWIFCSSDPASLDGVTLCVNGRSVALLDGTAPHECDTRLPGAVDSLVNLGDGWDEDALARRRPDIATLGEAKRRAYQKAYEYLSLSSKYALKSKAEIKNLVRERDAQEAANAFFDLVKSERHGPCMRRPTAAFCRYGYVHLPTYEHAGERTYMPATDPLLRPLVLSFVAARAQAEGLSFLRAPSPFSDEETDALFFPTARIALIAYTPQNEQSVAPFACGLTLPSTLPCALLLAEDIRRELLARAQRELSYAAEAHASLEAIYTAAMDFSANDRLTDTLVHRIDRVLYGVGD